jgi:uncharacterized protein with HEPN domain/predicted nucleotidyltransferase
MPIAKEITQKMPQVYQLLEQFDVSDAWVFGSGQSGRFSKDSDVDIMVQFKEKLTPLRLGMNMNELSFSLQKLFEREVDLVSFSHIKNPAFFSQVSENSTRIYGEENPRLYVRHMMNCIVKIQTFMRPVKSFHAYKKEFLIQAGVEWNLTILGEAAKRLKNISPDVEITDIDKIIGTRNKLIHGYDDISHEEVYAIVRKNLPELKRELKKLL